MLSRVLEYVRFHGLSYTLRHGAEKMGERLFRTYDRVYRILPELEKAPQQEGQARLISILIPLYQTKPVFLKALLDSLLAQTDPRWEACLYDGGCGEEAEEILKTYAGRDPRFRVKKAEKNEGIAGNTNRALEMAQGDWICLCDHDDLLTKDALARVQAEIARSGADVVYTDEDKVTEDGRVYTDAHFKPDFSPDSLRSASYVCHLLAVKRDLMVRIGGEHTGYDGSQDHDLVLRLSETAGKIAHAPGVCYHWRTVASSASHTNRVRCMEASCRAVEDHMQRIGFPGHAEGDRGVIRLTWEIQGTPSVEILLIGGREEDGEKLKAACGWKNTTVRVLDDSGNRYAAMNRAAEASRADVLLFLDRSVSGMQENTVREMLMYAQRPDVGGVTAALTDRRGRITHAGYAFGSDFPGFAVCRQAFLRLQAGGWHILARQAHNVGALSAACIMVRRDHFLPFDETYTGGLGSVDWSIRMLQKGFVHVYTPHGSMLCENRPLLLLESGADENKEENRMKDVWKDFRDPCYSPCLSTKGNFRLDPDRARRSTEEIQTGRE